MISKAIRSINPNAVFIVGRNSVDEITWHEGTEPIEKSKIEEKVAELESEYNSLNWERSRKENYPDLESCIHALLDGGDTLTELQAKRAEVKTKYPKPSE